MGDHTNQEPPRTGDAAARVPKPARHHVHRWGGYFGVDADVSIGYGDGTSESLAALLAEPERDPWEAPPTLWGGAESSAWGPPPEDDG
jgi:hypothetical protein